MTLSNINNICLTALTDPVVGTPLDRRLFISPYNNAVGDSRFIDPVSRDYVFNANGKTAGLFGVQQQVFLALTTQLGSSASVNLGETYNNIKIIASSYNQDLNNAITLALAPLITAGRITLNGIIVTRPNNSTAVVVTVDWTDLTQTTSQLTSQNYGKPPVAAPPVSYDCSQTVGRSPEDIPFMEVDFRADRGVVAPYGLVTDWWNEGAYDEEGSTFDLNRNATQATVASQPRFNPIDILLNNQPSITFGQNQFLETGQWTDGYLFDPMTVALVGYWQDNASTYVAFDGYSGQQYQFLNASGTLEIKESSTATGSTPTLVPNVYIIVFNGANSYYKQSSNSKTFFSGTPGNTLPLGLTIGNSLAGNQGGMTIAEIAVFTGELSAYYQDSLLQFFSNRYGITIT